MAAAETGAPGLPDGTYDIHVHCGPDLIPRKMNDIQLAEHYRANGVAGAVLKHHFCEMGGRAQIAAHVVPGVRLHGSVVCNRPVGGLNAAAVYTSVRLGARIVWLPTVDAANHRAKLGGGPGLRVLDGAGRLVPEVEEILDLVLDADIALATGHLAVDETLAVVRRAQERGLKRVLVTHPEFWVTHTPLEVQRTLVGLGATFERCYYASTLPREHRTPFETTIEWLRALGTHNTVLASDLGQPDTPSPAEGLQAMVTALDAAGFTTAEIETMLVDNPRWVAGD